MGNIICGFVPEWEIQAHGLAGILTQRDRAHVTSYLAGGRDPGLLSKPGPGAAASG